MLFGGARLVGVLGQHRGRRCCEGEGEDAKITVSFPRHGVKKLVEKYATLSQE